MDAFTRMLSQVRHWREVRARRKIARLGRSGSQSRFRFEPLEQRFLLSAAPLEVTALSIAPSGFTVQFNQAVDATVLSLYDTQGGALGAADVTLIGDTQGAVKGSLVVRDSEVTFVKTGGILEADNYTVTLRSASNGLRSSAGDVLDGNRDGIPGDDYTNTFTIAAATGPKVSIRDFARGPGQVIQVPTPPSSTPIDGIPISISDGTGVTSVDLTLRYDPALLRIVAVTPGATLPAGSAVQSNFSVAGTLTLQITSPTAMPAGALDLVRVVSEVPHTAPYGATGVLDIGGLSVNNGSIAAVADDGIEVATYFGEATGNRSYSALDGSRILRVVVGLDGGFAASPFVDPVILTDITNNGLLSALDGTRILQEVVGLDRDEIAAITADIQAQLAHDTGVSSSDQITLDPSISGTVFDDGAISSFRVKVDNGAFVDATADLTGGNFNLNRTRLEQIFGATLGDGTHLLRFQATDNNGNISTISEFSFSLDTVLPNIATFGLSPGSDTGIEGDNITAASKVILTGASDTDAILTLNAAALLGGSGGVFQVPDVDLVSGANAFILVASDLAGNATQRNLTITRQGTVTSDVVLQWNQQALDAIRLTVTHPQVATRIMAMVSLAQYDTLAAIEGTPAYLIQQPVSGPVSLDAALAKAAHTVLYSLFPSRRSAFDTALNTLLAAIADGAAKTNGLALGLAVGNGVLAIRANDGSDAYVEDQGSEDIGKWRPTGPTFEVPEEPQWGDVTPFALSASDALRPPAPPDVTSAQYAVAVEEIRSLGTATGSTRTADQTQMAQFWADGKGSYTPPGHWNQIAQNVALAKGNSVSANVRLFAQLNVAMADAAIAAWDAKYTYDLWRPVDAIQHADQDGNPATVLDAAWTPLLITPAHPEYVSGHSSFSASAAGILAATFGENTAFSATSFTLPGVTRNFTSFTQAVQEAGRSRIYGGIHYEFTNQAGQQLGRQVAAAVLQRFAWSQDTQPPAVFASAIPASTNTNVTLTGQIFDNISGVAQAQFKIDNGALQPLTLDSQGHFSITTAFSLNGSSDGLHSITILTQDSADNIAPAFIRSFTLDTLLPTITLSSIADNAVLNGSSRLTGIVNSTGTNLTQLNYRLDAGTTRSLAFDGSGNFDDVLAFGTVDVGSHTLLLTARDAAGNTATLSRTVTVDALAPFLIASLTPSNGAIDVGVTQRPQISFSRPVNTATLNSSSFYATGPDGSVLPATIVPALDGSYAWLFFSPAMPGGSQVTVHVDGSKIRAAADGAFLDADANGVAGGVLTQSFTTVSSTAVAGTSLYGNVYDPGPDLLPMTFDDIRRGPDGIIHTPDDVFLLPISHAKVYILGQEDNFVFTAANGSFTLDNIASGNAKVVIDGRTSTNPPSGVFFPEMVMNADFLPGVTQTLMGSMGSLEERTENAARSEVYLPRVATGILQDISNVVPTTVTVDADSAPNLTDQQRQALTLTVAPGSAIGENGQVLSNVQIGISTVPPELVRDMLPPGVLQHTFDITIQAPGVATFAEPVQITLPNVFGAAPGTKLNILSFDHTTGLLVINGTGTVSADGLTVVSDVDAGVRSPGWHGLTPPGAPSDPPCDPTVPHIIDVPPVMNTSGIHDYLFMDDNGEIHLSFGNFAQPIDPGSDPCDPINMLATPLLIDVTLDDASAGLFTESLNTQSFSLLPGQVGNINATVSDKLDIAFIYDNDRLYGVKVNIHAHWIDKDGMDHDLDGSLPDTELYVYRFLDIADNRHEDGKIDFSRTAVPGSFTQLNPLPYLGDGAATPVLTVSGGTNFSFLTPDVRFDPTAIGALTDVLQVKAPDNAVAGQINLAGTGIALQNVFFSLSEFNARIKAIVDASPAVAGNGRLVSLFPDSDGDGSRTTGADLAGFTAAVASLHSDITVQFYVAMLGVDSNALQTVTLVNGVPGTGDKVNLVNVFQLPAGSTLYTGGAAAVWADFGIDYFLNSIVAVENNLSDPQTKYLFEGLFDRSDVDNSGSPFVPGGTGMIMDVDTMMSNVPAAATGAAFRPAMVNQFASTIAHEFGHLLGAIHQRTNTAPYSSNFLMGRGTLLTTIPAIGPDFIAVFKAALGIPSTKAEFNAAYSYYKLQANNDYTLPNQAYAFNNGGNPVPGPGHPTPDAEEQPYLTVVDGPADDHLPPNVVTDLDFGTVLADGAGGAVATRTVYIFNTGSEHLHLDSVAIVGGAGISVSGFSGPVELAAFDENNPAASRLALTLTFDPTALGSYARTLRIGSDSSTGSTLDIPLEGVAVSPFAHVNVQIANNNLGGVKLGQTGVVNNFGTIRNDGSQALTITGITDPTGRYHVTGLPGSFPGTPIVLLPGVSMQFNVTFTPDATGLRPSAINIASNDPSQPIYSLRVTGTGLAATGTALDYGNDFVALRTQSVLRTVSDGEGNWTFFLPPVTPFQYTMFDTESGLVAVNSGTTAPSGESTEMPTPVFRASTANDSDSDGLPDDVEFAIGSNAQSKDTDHDGLDDFTEIEQGLDPLGGLGIPIGVVSATTMQGTAQAVTVIGKTDGSPGLTALVATGSYGLATVDASKIKTPLLLNELNLSGTNTDVAADALRGLAVVAGNEAGLHIVDVSDPSSPTLVRTIAFGSAVTRVEVRDGIAYVANGSNIATVDLNTGDVRTTLNLTALGGTALTDIAIDGNTLFTMDTDRTLRAITIVGDVLTQVDSLSLANGGGKLFVGGGVAYVGTVNDFAQGYLTVNVANPADLQLLSGVDATNIAGQSLAANGSGLLVTVGNLRGPQGQQIYALDIGSSTDPANTGSFISRIDLPAAPKDLVLAGGLAFVADGASGLQIVNYVGFDTLGLAPVVSITATGVDADPGTPGVQVLEGRTVRVLPTITDDVQLRNVELIVNGQVVSNDVSFPFELFAQTPTIAAGGNTMTLMVRATDTGGNVALSNTVTLSVVPDTFPPLVSSVSLAEGARLFFVRSVDVVFDEPLDLDLLSTSGVSLVRLGTPDVPVVVRLDTRNFGQALSVVIDTILPAGDYHLQINPSIIADNSGNALAAAIVRNFAIRPASDVHAVSGVPEIPTAPSANPGQQIGIAVPFNPSNARADIKVTDGSGNVTTQVVNVLRIDAALGLAYFTVPLNAVTGDAVVYSQVGAVRTDFADGTFPLQILPTIVDVDVESVNPDGSTAQLLIAGTGFIEGGSSEYRFGNEVVTDSGINSGPDVFGRSDSALGFLVNGYARVTVPLSNGAFGAINVKTAGGVSANYAVNLASITAAALSGSPTDAGQASANAGQAILLNGSGLNTSTDVLLRYVDYNGTQQMVLVSPSFAAADGTSATVVLPAYVNGAFALQVFGSASQPMLQIVPTISSIDIQDRTVLFGSGYVEGAASYNFAGATVTDTPADPNDIDVYYDNINQNRSAYINRTALPTHGLGNVTVTTAGGTSAAFALNTVRVSLVGQYPGDVAVNAAGNLWVSDYNNPGHLLRIDAATGQALQTITLTDSFGTPYLYNLAGLQVLSASMTLGATSVPAGSLLVFNGYVSPDRVLAVDPATGAILASLVLDGNYDLTGAAFNPGNGHLYLTENNGPGNRIIELSAITGAQLAVITVPFNIQSWAGLAIDSTTGHLWLGSVNGGAQLAEFRIDGTGTLTELRRIDVRAQRIDNSEISGLSFAADGKLWVSSTQGEIYKIDVNLDTVAVPTATLSQVIAVAGSGAAANTAQASANVGQVIELVGTNFGAGTRILFDTRDNNGDNRVVSQSPLVINAVGTRLQVQVPDIATTGNVRVVNQAARDLGFTGNADAVYRAVTVNFTAGGTGAVIRFRDGGLQGVDDESWALDNVVVMQGDATVFADNFETGTASGLWSDGTVNSDGIATFSRFSGRFSNNASQTLTLGGLTAGQSYSLTFDLLVFDSWDGNNSSAGPDLIDVSVDGVSKLRETLANYPDFNSAQTFRASNYIPLQIVPTLTGLSGGRPGEDTVFNLLGSGFMEGASTVTIGGVVLIDTATNLNPFNVTGASNSNMTVVAPRTLDGPIRISTEGGSALIPGADFSGQPVSVFTGIVASASGGTPASNAPSAVTGQSVTLQGQGFTSSTLVQFQGIDDTGALGTLTRTGTVGGGGTTLSVVVPALARTGGVVVLGSGASIDLQIVPTLKAVGGTIAVGNTIVLVGTGLTANDLAISIDGRGVGSFELHTIIDGTSTTPDQQLLKLTVPAGVSVGAITVSTAGGQARLRTGATFTTNPTITPGADVGETLATATDLGLGIDRRQVVNSAIGTTGTSNDVDLYRVDLNGDDTLSIAMTGSVISTRMRVFDAAGTQLNASTMTSGSAAVVFIAPSSGAYYIGISASSNTAYNPAVAGSGTAGTAGDYQLNLDRLGGGASRLTGITATASSGTATNSGIASANTGQTITVAGTGLVTGDQLVFTTEDDSGNLSEVTVTPTIDLVAQTMTAVTPATATTGRVRLARDRAGMLLQIVPTLTDLTITNSFFIGGNLQLTGTGFAEGASAVLMGGLRVDDAVRNQGLDVTNSATRINLTLPVGAPTGPVSVSTVGGTSAAFNIGFTGLSGTAIGTPGNLAQASANPGQVITLDGSGLDSTTDVVFLVIDQSGNYGDVIVHPSTVSGGGTQVQVRVPNNAVTGLVRVAGSANGFNLQILPTIVDVDVESVNPDGSTVQLLISGTGFVEDSNTEYRIGTRTLLDAGSTSGPDVFGRSDAALGYVDNGNVHVTVPLSNGVFGAINIKTTGGVSADYTVNLATISAVALSGTPADTGKASANAGQAIVINGSGLGTSTDVLLRFLDINGMQQMLQLSPSTADADGTSATLVLPNYVNGAFALQVFGSASQPLLQIVPTIDSIDIQDRTVLFGSGYVEGAASYNFAGAVVTDTPADPNNIDVYYDNSNQNRSAYISRAALPAHGLGNVMVTTAGGTSAAFALNTVRVNVAGISPGDVAVNAAGNLWVSDYNNPGHLLRIDAATGQALQTLTLTDSFGTPYLYNHAGLQVLSAPMTLGATIVPAGSLLVFNGYVSPDRVLAVDPATGAILASLVLDGNYDLTGAVFNAVNGHIYLTENNGPGNRIIEVSATTGVQAAVITAPFNIQSWSGMAIHPATGHLWLGSANGGPQLVEYRIDGTGVLTELRRIDVRAQGADNNEISGLSFATDGSLWVSSTQGEIFKIDTNLDTAAVPTATLSQVIALAGNGTAANSGDASANVGQVIELVGTNFGAGTRVLFDTRDINGDTRVMSQFPLVINSTGTRLQVQVPDAATTGNVRVVNQASRNLGFTSYSDAVYRAVTVNFTAGSAGAVIRFSDAGLEGIDNESWGIDNVVVRQGGTTVFAVSFENGTASETGTATGLWSDGTVNSDGIATFSRFSGRFSNNASQTLTLGGLTAGLSYSLTFDLLVIDSWDGNSLNSGPDLIDVSVDGVSKLHETLANYPDVGSAQTFRASSGIWLQIVPTLTGLNGGRPGEDTTFNLLGSGFMEGASTVTIGGVALVDTATNLSPFDVNGTGNSNMSVVAPRTLDGPIRITTEGGYAEIPGADFSGQPVSLFTGITAVAVAGVPANLVNPSAVTGQTITLNGQGFTNSTLVQFQGVDDTGALGTLTRTGTANGGGTTLSVVVPALARTGTVTVLGSGAGFNLLVVPSLKAVGGTVTAGNTIILEGTGLTRNDLVINIDGQAVGAFAVRTIIDGASATRDQQLVTLTVPVGVGAGLITVSTAGGTATVHTGATITANGPLTPGADVGETLATATDLALGIDHRQVVSSAIGTSGTSNDVDLYRVDLNGDDTLSIVMTGSVITARMRVFDAAGTQLNASNMSSATAAVLFVAPSAGAYYIGISASSNTGYNPTVAGSGTAGTAGAYQLNVDRLGSGATRLTGITTSAASGTATNTGIGSANTGQTITVAGVGLVTGDQLVFTTVDDSGNLSEATVTPTIDLVAQTMTAVTPATATTGRVRLARERGGLFLQIVPTLTDLSLTNSNFIGGNLQLSGTGFAEGSSAVLLGGLRIDDAARNQGVDVSSSTTRINLTVPAGAPAGPIQVITVGGTSTAFSISFTGLTGTAASGTPGNPAQASANPGQTITVEGSGLDTTTDVVFQIIDESGNLDDVIVRPTSVNGGGTQAQVRVPNSAVTGAVRVAGTASSFNLQILPTIVDVQVEYVSSDGSYAQLLISGTGFVEGSNSEYRFGAGTVLDGGSTSGPDVFSRFDAVLGSLANGNVHVTVPLSNGVFGAINIKTTGGVSANYSVNLASITAVALSGTPADAGKASANAGQTITLNGSGLKTSTDVLLRFLDINGTMQTFQLSPPTAAPDGTSATLVLPNYVNGAFALQVFGSASQPLLQIVPTITSIDIQDRTVLFGSGYVEGASVYSFAGATATDTPADPNNIDVYYDNVDQNRSAYLNRTALPTHGLGNVTVTTAGGTSAAFALNTVRVTVAGTSPGDVAVNAAGDLWVSDYNNPGHLLRIDAATGQTLQTLTLTDSFGTPYLYNLAGLQVLSASMTLGATSVPAGSLLVFNGYVSPDRVLAVDPVTGVILASLVLDGNYDLSSAVFNPGNGHFYLTENNGPGNRIIELSATTGAQVAVITAPFNIQSWSGLAIEPATGHLWLGSYSGGAQLVEFRIDGTGVLVELRRVDATAQGINQNEISGLSFGPDGKLWVASTQGEIYKVNIS